MSTNANSKVKEKKDKPLKPRLASSLVMASEDIPVDQHVSSMEDLKNMQDTVLKTINTWFDLLDEKFTSLQSSHNSLVTQMDEIDETVSDHEAHLQSMETAINKLRKENPFLRAKTNYLEGRSRRSNVKFVGIPEGEEKGHLTEFISTLIPKLLGETHFPKPVIVECTHRSQQPKPAEGASSPAARPRTIITWVHHYQEREAIIRLAWQQSLKYGTHKVFIFPDYTTEVMEQRPGFREAMTVLRELKIKHSLRFPVKLHFQHNGLQRIFTSPKEAMTFVGN